MSRYIVDIDGVLCHTRGTDYRRAKPNWDIIKRVNSLYNKGHYIIITTGRGLLSGRDYEALTVRQLTEWGVKYHEYLPKQAVGVIIDDMAYRPDEQWPDD